jgi:O-antigen/teichoic acid export membrane protein
MSKNRETGIHAKQQRTGRLHRILAFTQTDQMFRHSALLFCGYFAAHLLNTFYQMVVSRQLAPEEYTILAAFVSALLILQYPLMTLTTTLSRFSSLLYQQNRHGDVARLLTRWIIRAGLAGTLGALCVVRARHTITDMLHINQTATVLVAALSIPAFFMLPIVLGISQGIERFGWNALTTTIGSLCRLLLGSLLVLYVMPTSAWGLLGHGLGTGLNMVLLLFGLYFVLKTFSPTDLPLPRLRSFLLQNGVVQISYAILMTADVILITHFIPEEHEFAYAATLGRLAVFLSSTIVIAMFPKVTTDGGLSRKQHNIFKQSLVYTATFAILAILGCFLFSRLLLLILYGIDTPSISLRIMTGAMAAVMGVSALLNTCLQYLVAQKRFYATIWVVLMATLYIVASVLWHQHSWQILLWAGIFNTAAMIALLIACLYKPKFF